MAKHYPNLNAEAGGRAVKEVRQPPGEETVRMLESLQAAVRKCLERKLRLGQYAVIWKDREAQRLLSHSTGSVK